MAWHPSQRSAVVDALLAAGPGAPTCCEGWRTEHLAAHLVLREGSPLVGLGLVVPPLADRTERITRETGDRASSPEAYRALVERVRAGAPALSPLRWAGDAAQLVELFVHTEDVRRGGGRGSAAPRELSPALETALWKGLSRVARFYYQDSPVGVVLADDDGRSTRARRTPGQRRTEAPVGPEDVVVRGDVGELLLHAHGRSTVAEVSLEGPAEAVAALRTVRPER